MTREDARRYARWIAGLRVAIGAIAVVAPTWVTRLWLGPGARHPDHKVLARSAGARDVAVGMCVILAS